MSRCTTCAPEDLLEDVIKKLRARGGLPILVMDGWQLTGIITARDVLRLAQRRQLRRDGAG